MFHVDGSFIVSARHRLVNISVIPLPKKERLLVCPSEVDVSVKQNNLSHKRRLLLNLSVLLIDEVVDGIGERPAADRLARYRRPRARRSVWPASFLGKFPGCKD